MPWHDDRLIVALDVPDGEAALTVVDKLGDAISCYKVGMDIFYGLGHTVLAQIAGRGKKLFIDLKLHDIPTTVGRTVSGLCQFSPAFITLHAAGGAKMLQAAVEAAQTWAERYGRPRPRLLAITVLTSIGEGDWAEMGYQSPIREAVLRLSVMCKEAGLDGVVASPQEAAAIHALCGAEFLVVTPGIRLPQESPGDQTRTATPSQALRAGADYLVVGRPITAASDPAAVTAQIIQDMRGVNRREDR